MICELEFGNFEKIFSSYSSELQPKSGDYAIFKFNQGEEIGKILRLLPQGKTSTKILRLANQEDLEIHTKNKKEATEALNFCKEKVKELGIPIKVASLRLQFDKSLLHIDFLAEKRVALRRLVYELARTYKKRIEFHQIGARTYACRFHAIGVCGRPICCSTFLKEFEPITMRTVKSQNLSCGASKLTGVCGRLMCCLAYEKKIYEEKSNT